LDQPQHPDYDNENRKLKETLQIIRHETHLTARQEKEQHEEVESLRKHSGGIYLPELYVKETIYRHTVQTLRNLRLAKDKPYFTRVDFQEKSKKDVATYYIGKYGVIHSETQQPVIIDWRSPVANLYYSGQTGPSSYDTPEGLVEGELLLKRQFGIRNGKLETIFDTEVVSQDLFLQSVLGSYADHRLKDIVTTIQKEQNDIIRAPREKPLIVQGVAGSGKTTIALHRIAFLLYTYQDIMAPENMMILAPNPLFLNYISDVLPDLGVENVVQTTFYQLTKELTDGKLPPLEDDKKLQFLLDPHKNEEEKEDLTAVSQFKGSLLYKKCIEDYVAWLETHIVPPHDVKLGPLTLYTHQEMQRFFIEDLAPFPFSRRIKEAAKHLHRKFQEGAEKLIGVIEGECQKRIALLKRKMEDTEERRAIVTRIYDNRDKRIKEIWEAAKLQEKQYMALWPKLDLLSCYRDFLQESNPSLSKEVDRSLWQKTCRHSLSILNRKRIETEDLAPLICLQQKINGLSKKLQIYHTVIDEAQDFSIYQFDVLKNLAGNSSFTIVGDLSQGIHSYRGIQNWQDAMKTVFADDDPQYASLIQSYRNTIEIMEFANRVAEKAPYPGQVLANPVLRHGEEPVIMQMDSPKEVYSAIADRIMDLQREGYKTIAIIDKTTEACRKTVQALRKTMDIPIQMLNADDRQYQGGIMVIPSYMAKGLEFDVVIMADVSEASFGADPLDARLLYVCFTRPLHRLYGYYVGRISPLLL